MISMFMIYQGNFVNENDYKVYSMNASSEIDKLFNNLTPDYLGSMGFNINSKDNLIMDVDNLTNLLS